jgi:hypothetical protein
MSEPVLVSKPQLRSPSAIVLTSILLVLGLALIFQSGRWSHTPAYGNLLLILSADVWGCIYLAAALFMLIALFLEHRVLSKAAHTCAFIVFAVWEGAFIIRYLTDSSTTVANVVAWAAYLFITIRSAQLIDGYRI